MSKGDCRVDASIMDEENILGWDVVLVRNGQNSGEGLLFSNDESRFCQLNDTVELVCRAVWVGAHVDSPSSDNSEKEGCI